MYFSAWHALLPHRWSLGFSLRPHAAGEAPLESNRLISGPKYHHLPPGFSVMHAGRLSWSFSHIDGTCPDLTLLFSREMTNHLGGAAPLTPAPKSNRYEGQWKRRRAEDTSTATMMPVEGWCQDSVPLITLYAHFFQNIPAQDEEKSPRWGEPARLHSVKPRGRWMALKSHRSEKEEGQSTKAICCHLRTSAEQRGSEHQDHTGNPCGAATFIHQTGQSRGHGSVCQSPAKAAGP